MEANQDGPVATRPLRLQPPNGHSQSDSRTATTLADSLRRTGGDVARAVSTLRYNAPLVAPNRPVKARNVAFAAVTARTIAPNTVLNPGDEAVSDSGNTKLAYQGDGNLVVYVRRSGVMPSMTGSDWVPRWASNTYRKPAGRCVMQGDGNLVVYQPDGKAIWSSNTRGTRGCNTGDSG